MSISSDLRRPALLRIDEVARALNVSPSLTRRLIRTGQLKSVLVSKCRRVPREDIERAIRDGIPARVAEEAS